jgi:hypothetical protein
MSSRQQGWYFYYNGALQSPERRNRKPHNMAILVFSILTLLAIANICIDIAMRIRLTKRQSSEGKLYWWRHGGDEMESRYEELYPDTYLPVVRRYLFCFVIAAAAVLLIASRLKST